MIFHRLAAFALAAALVAPVASAQTDSIDFTLTNNTDYHLTHLYISVPATNDWEEDIFGADVLAPGETFEISIDDGLEDCVYDIRADFEEGTTIDIRNVDFCALDGAELVVNQN